MSLPLRFYETPSLTQSAMVISFTGWMDGGDVSTGATETIINKLSARALGEILPADFYIYNFPGTMEVSSLFRPTVTLEDGRVKDFQEPTNVFFYNPEHRLVIFMGKEPNLNWRLFSDCVFEVARRCDVNRIIFIGSVSGLVPHTREPRFTGVVSRPELRPFFAELNVKPSDYQGPGSIINLFHQEAPAHKVDMISLVAEIPAYVQGRNPRAIEASVRRIAKILGLEIPLDELRIIADEVEKKLDKVVAERPELAEHIKTLEENYDQEIFEEMGDLKDWLNQQGIRMD